MNRFILSISCKLKHILVYIFILLMHVTCNNEKESQELFTQLSPEETGVFFSNDLKYSDQINAFTYHNFYNGGGVAVGDINNDGLPDLFFCGNLVPNKLYLNKGDFKFEDISAKAEISTEGLWYSGATFADVNGDGLLDLYVCRASDFLVGWRGNELYINNGDLTFSEKATEYGLANSSFSTHAVFFDMDNDSDLDCYLLSNSSHSSSDYYHVKDLRNTPDPVGGNKLYRNDNNRFSDVTESAKIFGSSIGFGLGVTISDINKDGWQDIYVSNDFFERDYLYINNHNGTFTELLEKYIREISMFSMGADIADINNDAYPDIYVTDMLPELESRVKTKTSFENWEKYQSNLDRGFYQQFLRNVLQLNRGPLYNGATNENEFYFSEIGRLAGVSATDWSWGALIADLDNDGYKDIFVSNGMSKDVTDQDFIQFMVSDSFRIWQSNKKKLFDRLPSTPMSNYAFKNNGNLTFTNQSAEWGLSQPGFSNGSAYADLDNDGDLDLITNNVNDHASLYKNNSSELHAENKFLKVVLQGEGNNTLGLGAKVTVHYNNTVSYQEEMPARGFESSVDNRLNFGLGKTNIIDSIRVDWLGGKSQLFKNVKSNQTLIIKQREASNRTHRASITTTPLFKKAESNCGIDFFHTEDDFVDFDIDKLTFNMLSRSGPHVTASDVNNDGLVDLFFCGARNQAGALYLQSKNGKFKRSNQLVFEADKVSEDTDCLFFDADADGDYDLFVCSGGNVFSDDSENLKNRLYLNDGNGNFSKSKDGIPLRAPFENSSTVSATDFDMDGDVDVFVGGRLKPGHYGYPCRGYLFQNDGKGKFTDVTKKLAPVLLEVGMITDAEWFDYDRDNKPDLVVAGEFMPIRIFHNEANGFIEVTDQVGLNKSNGWWNKLTVCDLNNDGYPDLVAGNQGLNSRFEASESKPVTLYVSDFDSNGTIEQILCTYNGDTQYPLPLRHDLVSILPYLKKKYLKYEDYKEKTIFDIFSAEQIEKALKLNAFQFQSCVVLNNTKGEFILKPFPVEAQFSSVYAVVVNDFDSDKKMDILLGGNFYQAKPEIGIQDASYGVLLKGDGTGNFTTVPYSKSNLLIKGAVRDMVMLKANGKKLIVVSKNDDALDVLEY